MNTHRNALAENKLPVVLIDTNLIRKHLFKGWPVLNRIAAIAHDGKFNLCVPWIVEQEVLFGINDHVDEVTKQEAFLTSVRHIAKLSEECAVINELCDKFEAVRTGICDDARRRFQHWIQTSQAERLPIRPDHPARVFESYFTGGPPFDRAKNREHLPDAFIYACVLDLLNAGRDVRFVGADTKLIGALRRMGNVRIYSDFYLLFADFQSSFDYAKDQALAQTLPDTQLLCELAQKNLYLELRGRSLRHGQPANEAIPKLQDVIEIGRLSVDRQSVIHINDTTLLIAFEADLIANAVERLSDGRSVVDRFSRFELSIRGRFLVDMRIEGPSRTVIGLEVDDFEVGSMKRNADTETLLPIVPQPEVASVYKDQFDATVSGNYDGLIVVVGSTLRNRQLVTEFIVASTLKRGRIGFINFPRSRPGVPTVAMNFSDIWAKAQDTEADVVGLSSEDEIWTESSIYYLAHNNALVVATMKTAGGRKAVVRHLASSSIGPKSLGSLLAVAWIQNVTAETISFAISRDSGWGDGSWEEILHAD